MITHLEPDILECEVKWALERITMNKARGGDGIPVRLFQILKDLTVENSERDGHTRPLDLPLEKPICRSGSNS